MPSPTCSEKLLRDTLLRDERERQQQLSSPPTRPLLTRRRYSHAPTSSDFAHTEYARGSSLFRTAMSSSRSPSSSSSSEQEQDRESPVRRRLFYGGSSGDKEARAYQQQQPQQQSPMSTSPRTRRDSSTSASPSPLRTKRRQESLDDPITHSTANLPTNVPSLRRNQSLQYNRYGLSPSHGPSEHGAGSGHIMMRVRYGNEVRDEQGGWPWKRGRQSIRSGSESMISESFSASHSSHSHSSQTPTRTHDTTPNRATTSNNQHYYSPSSPHAPYSGVRAASPSSPSFNRTRSQTNANTVNPNTPSPRRNNSSPSTLPVLKPTTKSPSPIGEVEEAIRLPTPPPSPHTYSQRKKEGLELRMPAQGPARNNSHQVLRSPTGPKKNADGRSLTSSGSCSTRTSVSSVSPLHSCSSHSSLDEPLPVPHDHHQSSTPFNARKASTQCRAIEGYVSFASVEGLGEPPLVRDEFDENGFGDDVRGKGRKGSVPFLPLDVLGAAFGWKRFLGGGDAGPGVEGPVVV